MTVAERDEGIEELIESGRISIHSACKRKARYPSANEARHAAKAVGARMRRDMVHYKCPWCGHHHIAKKPHEDAA